MTTIHKFFRFAGVLAVVFIVIGCGATRNGIAPLNSVSELQENDIVLVGRVELVPPLTPAEQNLKTGTSERFRNKAAGIFSNRQFDLNNLPISIGNHAIMAEMGKEFFARQPRNDEIIYSGSFVLMNSTASQSGYMGRNVSVDMRRMNLPGGLKFQVKPDDRAVYIGTIRYHRDDFNSITKIEMINDYQRVNEAFKARFGNGINLRHIKPQRI